MTDKVQKIKDWISKEQDGLMDAQGNFENPSDEGAFHILSNLDTYIDSLQEESVSEDLEKAYEKYADERLEIIRPDIHDSSYSRSTKMTLDLFEGYELETAFEEGANWQKKQMMAKAIDGVVTFDYYDSGDRTYGCVAHDSFCLEDFGIKDRDKVKVIVIKEE